MAYGESCCIEKARMFREGRKIMAYDSIRPGQVWLDIEGKRLSKSPVQTGG